MKSFKNRRQEIATKLWNAMNDFEEYHWDNSEALEFINEAFEKFQNIEEYSEVVE